MSRIYFPLATSVELFGDRRTPAAVTRLKQAAVLYDELFIDMGMLAIRVLDTGASNWWYPPHQLTDEMLEHSREPIKPGTPFSLGVARQPALGVPAAGPFIPVLQGRVVHDFCAEFHTGILDELQPLQVDWAHVVGGGGMANPDSKELSAAINALNFADFGDSELMPDRNHWEKDFVYKAFNHDSVIAADLGAAFNVTPVFNPMVARRDLRADFRGAEALDIQVPNVGALPWEVIVEFRDHPGSQEARQKLREFEEKAAASEPADAYEFLKRVNQEMARAYQQAFEELRPKLPQAIAKEAGKTAVALIPVVGPFVEKGATIAELVSDAVHNRHSWVAALMELR